MASPILSWRGLGLLAAIGVVVGCHTVSNMGERAQAITARGNASLQVEFTSPQFLGKETRRGFSVNEIDGQRVKFMYVGDVHDLTPGPHEVEIVAQIQNKKFGAVVVHAGSARVKFVAEPGKQYITDGRIEADGATIWISRLPERKQVSDTQTVSFTATETPVPVFIPIPVL